ncbi:MAG: hypothetical protein JEZ02_14055 [Desulfatibacillum sp.]|nr:hypothetical protein [Desulfatibacillum sp.]
MKTRIGARSNLKPITLASMGIGWSNEWKNRKKLYDCSLLGIQWPHLLIHLFPLVCSQT